MSAISRHVLLLSVLIAGLGPADVAFARQTREIRIQAIVREADSRQPIPGANVIVWNASDSTRSFGAATGRDGSVAVTVPRAAEYRVRFTFIGFETLVRTVQVPAAGLNLGMIDLRKEDVRMDDVVVEGIQERVVIKGDTTEFNAAAYKVQANATVEDLVGKLPGVTVEGGVVQAQGEQVRRVLVDGREFFEGDPTAALRNLPSEVVEKIQVFDRMSDQDQFTGFNSGDTEKTINIITRTGRSNGQFGKVYGGYGDQERYIGGGNVNVFAGDRRISIIGLSNNINQQNFAVQDILGVVGSGGRRGGGGFAGMTGGGGGMRGGGGGGRGGDGGGGGAFGGGGGGMGMDPGSFLVGDQAGVNNTHSFGVNYSDQFSPKVRATTSYFFNASGNTTNVGLDREYLLATTSTQLYNETNDATSDNSNHRLSMRLQADLDDRNSIIFTPRFSFQDNTSNSLLQGLNSYDSLDPISSTYNAYESGNNGMTGSTGLLIRHRFDKPGRTVSANLNLGLNDRSGSSEMLATNSFYGDSPYQDVIDQRTKDNSGSTSLSANLAFTEPIGEGGQLQLNYTPSVSDSDSDRRAFDSDPVSGVYDVLDPTLSNTYENRTLQQRLGASLRIRKEKYSWNVGLNAQTETLSGDRTFPIAANVEHTFRNLLPSANFQLGGSRTRSLNLMYRTSTNTPSISQLQDVIDNTNPLRLSSGNPDLRSSYTHTVVARANFTDPQGGRVYMGFVSLQKTSNPIGTATVIATTDTEITPGVVLAQGSQYTYPINLDGGSWSARSFFNVGLPSGLLKSNVNLNAGVTFSRSDGMINNTLNTSDSRAVNGGLVLGSNISERVDFTFSGNLSYTNTKNSVYPDLSTDYVQLRGGLRLNWMPVGNWVIDSSMMASQYTGVGQDYDQSVFILNAGIGYRFLKGNGGELKLMVADILNQNTNISRAVTELYIQDQVSNVLGRYVLLNFTYTIRNFRL